MAREIITIKEVKQVEDFIKELTLELNRKELITKLKKKINNDEAKIKLILSYLERSGKILFTKAGVIWIYADNPKLRETIAQGVFV